MVSMCRSQVFLVTVRVVIINDLQNNNDLILHCKSGDDDLDEHVLPHGNEYSFRFNKSIFGTTQFFCGFNWKGGSKWFDIYIQKRDSCTRCEWKIRESGPCLIHPHKEICYPWNAKLFSLP